MWTLRAGAQGPPLTRVSGALGRGAGSQAGKWVPVESGRKRSLDVSRKTRSQDWCWAVLQGLEEGGKRGGDAGLRRSASKMLLEGVALEEGELGQRQVGSHWQRKVAEALWDMV